MKLKPIHASRGLSVANYFAIKNNNLNLEFLQAGEEVFMISDYHVAEDYYSTFVQLIFPSGFIWIRETELKESFDLVAS